MYFIWTNECDFGTTYLRLAAVFRYSFILKNVVFSFGTTFWSFFWKTRCIRTQLARTTIQSENWRRFKFKLTLDRDFSVNQGRSPMMWVFWRANDVRKKWKITLFRVLLIYQFLTRVVNIYFPVYKSVDRLHGRSEKEMLKWVMKESLFYQ